MNKRKGKKEAEKYKYKRIDKVTMREREGDPRCY